MNKIGWLKTKNENIPPFKVKNCNLTEKRGKKESPTENRRTFTRNWGGETGNFVVKPQKYLRKEEKEVSNLR